MYTQLLEQVLRKFMYMQGINKYPTIVTPATVLRRDVDEIFVEYVVCQLLVYGVQYTTTSNGFI